MLAGPPDLAQVRLDNAMLLFEEFVRATARHADAAALRGLERRFAERVQIQPSYWSQIKGRSRQIGERLARQFEHLCHKPRGWMDLPHDGSTVPAGNPDNPGSVAGGGVQPGGASAPPASDDSLPHDDDERFIVGLVLTYYRRHPQRARTRLLDLLGEVLVPAVAGGGAPQTAPQPALQPAPPRAGSKPGQHAPAATDDPHTVWLRSQSGVAPLKRR